jgi:hypothetical protein
VYIPLMVPALPSCPEAYMNFISFSSSGLCEF